MELTQQRSPYPFMLENANMLVAAHAPLWSEWTSPYSVVRVYGISSPGDQHALISSGLSLPVCTDQQHSPVNPSLSLRGGATHFLHLTEAKTRSSAMSSTHTGSECKFHIYMQKAAAWDPSVSLCTSSNEDLPSAASLSTVAQSALL